MATVSMSMTSAVSQMQGSLSCYTRSNDRRMVLRSLKNMKLLSCIPMEPVDQESKTGGATFRQLEEDFKYETIMLNGVAFHAKKDFLRTLQDLCHKLCDLDGVTTNPAMLYEMIVIHAAPTTSQKDSFFTLNKVVGSSDLMLIPVDNIQTATYPININVFVANGSVHGTVRNTVGYGLFRRCDVNSSDLKAGVVSGRPWINLHAVVDERVNFTTGESVRKMSVRLPDLY